MMTMFFSGPNYEGNTNPAIATGSPYKKPEAKDTDKGLLW
jgi:hypothetical protein